MPERDLYAVLGVERTATQDQIKSAFRKLARKYHPDVNPNNKPAEEKFKEVSAAFDVLGNDEKRKLYDEFGPDAAKLGFDAEKAKAYREYARRAQAGGGGNVSGFGGFGGFAAGGAAGEEVPFDLGDIFGDIFGQSSRATRGARRARRGQGEPGPRRGDDIEAHLTIDLADSVAGAERRLSLERSERCKVCKGSGAKKVNKCHECNGSGHVETQRGPMRFAGVCPECGGSGEIVAEVCSHCRGSGAVPGKADLLVTIPKGAVTGTVIRLAGQGGAGLRGGPPGDLLLTVQLRPHPHVRVEGKDLSLDLPVTVGEALRGAEVRMPTFDGDVQLTIPKGSPSGRKLRLKGRGLPDLKGGARGDLYAMLQIVLPQVHGKEAERLAKELDGLYDGDVRAKLALA